MNTTNETQLVIYETPNGETRLDVTVHGDTIWLTQRQIADLFGTKVPAISKHLKNIYESGELQREATISKMETVVNRGFRGASVEVMDHRESNKQEQLNTAAYLIRLWVIDLEKKVSYTGLESIDIHLKRANS